MVHVTGKSIFTFPALLFSLSVFKRLLCNKIFFSKLIFSTKLSGLKNWYSTWVDWVSLRLISALTNNKFLPNSDFIIEEYSLRSIYDIFFGGGETLFVIWKYILSMSSEINMFISFFILLISFIIQLIEFNIAFLSLVEIKVVVVVPSVLE